MKNEDKGRPVKPHRSGGGSARIETVRLLEGVLTLDISNPIGKHIYDAITQKGINDEDAIPERGGN